MSCGSFALKSRSIGRSETVYWIIAAERRDLYSYCIPLKQKASSEMLSISLDAEEERGPGVL